MCKGAVEISMYKTLLFVFFMSITVATTARQELQLYEVKILPRLADGLSRCYN